ncbi:hypothetical protein HYT23_03450 [Candidatus Pacearchaeota archaeon]|nr:hypothetical protein [Candidatus Pacearchaeota archaeon]
MKQERIKTYEEFRDDLKDRNYYLLLKDAREQLQRYSGVHRHSVNGLLSVINGELNLMKTKGTLEKISGLKVHEAFEIDDVEFVIKYMYEHWKMGVYLI